MKYPPIPRNKLIDGSTICFKNASRLAHDAKLLYDSKRYSSCLPLAVLALEELGKGYMLMRAYDNNEDITSENWKKEFKSHTEKLRIISKTFQTSPIKNPNKEKAVQQLSKLFDMLGEKKIESLYVDWNKNQNQWQYYDDCESDKQKIAEQAIKANDTLIVSFFRGCGDDDDLKFISTDKKVDLLLNHKVHCMCNKCGLIMMTTDEFKHHSTTFSAHLGDITWHRI